jgi:hypothetical protein
MHFHHQQDDTAQLIKAGLRLLALGLLALGLISLFLHFISA